MNAVDFVRAVATVEPSMDASVIIAMLDAVAPLLGSDPARQHMSLVDLARTNPKVSEAVANGRRVQAIRALRDEVFGYGRGEGLIDCKNAIEAVFPPLR